MVLRSGHISERAGSSSRKTEIRETEEQIKFKGKPRTTCYGHLSTADSL